jgi:hypothetical protein
VDSKYVTFIGDVVQSFVITFTAWSVVADRISRTSNSGKDFLTNVLYSNLMRGITFEVVTQARCIFRSAMLPLFKKNNGSPLAELHRALPSLFPCVFISVF